MNRLLLAGAIVGLSVAGCKKAPDSAGQHADTPAVAEAPHAAEVPASAATDTSHGVTQHDSVAVNAGKETPSDVTGAYMAVGKVPDEFAEIELLGLATIDDQGKPAPLNGFIRPKRRSAKDYKLIDPKLTGNDLVFTTEAVAGISYSFTGAFTKLGNFPENPPEGDTVLKGTLTKSKDGKTVATMPVSFSYSAGG